MAGKLMGMSQVAKELETDPIQARKLARAGLLGPFEETTTSRVFVSAEAVEKASRMPDLVAPYPEALVVRLSEMKEDDDLAWPQRRFIGYSTSMTETEVRDAARGWWRVADPESWYGHLLVATVVGYVIGAWKITDHTSAYGGLRRFELEAASSSDGADRFLGHRLKTGSGGNTVHLPAQDWASN